MFVGDARKDPRTIGGVGKGNNENVRWRCQKTPEHREQKVEGGVTLLPKIIWRRRIAI